MLNLKLNPFPEPNTLRFLLLTGREYTESEMLATLTHNGVEHPDRISSVTRSNSADCPDVVMGEPCVPSADCVEDAMEILRAFNSDCGPIIEEILGTSNAERGEVIMETSGIPDADCGEVITEEHRVPKADYWEVFIKECRVASIRDICSKLGWILTNYLYSTLGNLLQHGRNAEAEWTGRQALSGIEKNREKDHPEALFALDLLAGLLGHLGQYLEASVLYRKYLNKLGESEILKSLVAKSRLCAMLMKLGDYREAKKVSTEVVRTCKKRYGSNNPETLWAVKVDSQISQMLRKDT